MAKAKRFSALVGKRPPSLGLSVVVNGEILPVAVAITAKCQTILDAVLTPQMQVAAEWELRDADGRLLEPAVAVAAYGLAQFSTLYANPRAGVGA